MNHSGERKRLLVVRHAKSSWDDPAIPDHDRPLAPRGRKAIHRLRDHLEGLVPPPALVLCSSSVRTRETLDGIRPVLDRDTSIEVEASLYGADAEDLLDRLRCIDDRVGCVLLIGHNPGVADLTALLVNPAAADYPGRFPTAAAAAMSFSGSWAELGPALATLDSFWTPRPTSS